MSKYGFDLLLLMVLVFAVCFGPVRSDLVISKLDRRIDLTSQIVRVTLTFKVENTGPDPVSEVSLTFPEHQANNLALLVAISTEGRGKTRGAATNLPIKIKQPDDSPPLLTWYAASLPKELKKGESLNMDVLAVFTHMLRPFPEKITQAESQLFLFQDSAHFMSPYNVKIQSVTVKLPSESVEAYTKLENTKFSGSEIKYGLYENLPAFSYSPVVVHFPSDKPFVVAKELVREIEISHWGNVQVTEHYNIIHGGAQSTGEFSRLDFQARPHVRGASAVRNLIAMLPPRAHSIYYRDAIGNISTSNIYADSSKTLLEIEPRYPMFGGWKTSFTIGYGLPLQDCLFQLGGTRFLNITFGSPMNDVLIENLSLKVVLPEGSRDVSVSVPFSVKQSQETTFSHLDIAGRPTVVVEKVNVVPEHNQYFQVHYKFSNLSLLTEPLMLIFGIFSLFVACIIYMHADFTISKSSASYLAKLQWDEVQGTIQQLQVSINRCLSIHDKLEASLRELSRTGDVQACKAVRKSADSLLKDLSKESKSLLATLQSSPQAAHILPKVEELVVKEKDLQEKIMTKHTMVVDSYEKKSGGRDMESRVSSIQQKISVLKQEVDDLVEFIEDI
ncbi:dolichyl-diphosphooligosaccharide--protein glycosyltransferase subunit 1A-like [Bidens hawaiensis]|uniref:dolichyl-diphosphooligosaccharide--protein glycosyltransferase subunit 1A-like n=1 Tax=Bidens hawaiensis TaxID=980011 RepID=UPI00404B2E4E